MSSLFVIYKFQIGICEKIEIKTGINFISSKIIIDASPIEMSIIPYEEGFINGNILDGEVRLRKNDIINIGNIHLVVREQELVTIDLTKEEEGDSGLDTSEADYPLSDTPRMTPTYLRSLNVTPGYSPSPRWSPQSPSYTPNYW